MNASRTAPSTADRPEPRLNGKRPRVSEQTCPVCCRAFRSKRPATYCGGTCRMVACRRRKEGELRERLERAERAALVFIESLVDLRQPDGMGKP
jgi:hypothetical protein